jgi:hypothetical protein
MLPAAEQAHHTRHVLWVTLDGLRWQEVFRGVDAALVNYEIGGVREQGVEDIEATYAGQTPEEQRRVLMPFFWTEIATRGQLFGNRGRGSAVRVTNTACISYPGYSEMFTGVAHPDITSNGVGPNPHVTMLEWLQARDGFAGRVVPVVAWNVFRDILNVDRSGLPLWMTNQHSDPATATPRLLEIEQWMRDIPSKGRDEHYDGFVFRAALEFFHTKRPRLLFVGFGEPDTEAHARRYDRYLQSIRRCDRFIQELWQTYQADPEYAGATTLIVTTDHGRGLLPKGWIHHNDKVPGSDETWLAVLGPDTPARGERSDTPTITLAQLAATVAEFCGEDFRAAFPAAAGPVSAW